MINVDSYRCVLLVVLFLIYRIVCSSLVLLVILVLSMKFSGYSVADFLFLIGLLFPPDGFDHDVDSFTVQYLFFHYRPLPTITSITAKKYFFHCPSSRTAAPV